MFIALVAWLTIISLAMAPQLVFWEIVHAKKQETLQMLEDRSDGPYSGFKKKRTFPPGVEEILSLQNKVLQAQSFPVSGSELFSLLSALFLNLAPLLVRYLKLDILDNQH